MMYYICGKSGNKIVHNVKCRYVNMIPIERRKVFFSLKDAAKDGYVPCKYCSGIYSRMVRLEKKELEEFCKPRGIYYFFNAKENAIEVISKSGKWKIVEDERKRVFLLYHKNFFRGKTKGISEDYHKQKNNITTLLKQMEYIARHDQYRTDNPLNAKDTEKVKLKKPGSKNGKKYWKKMAKLKKKRDVNYVMDLIENIELGNITN